MISVKHGKGMLIYMYVVLPKRLSMLHQSTLLAVSCQPQFDGKVLSKLGIMEVAVD
jgi:hypothetical protein